MASTARFEVLSIDNKTWCYLLCFDKDGNVVSSNYYNSDTASRGETADLIIVDRCVIFVVCADYSLGVPTFYTAQMMGITPLNEFPTSGIIQLNFVAPQQPLTKANFPSIVDLSYLVGIRTVENPDDIIGEVTLQIIEDITDKVSIVDSDYYNKCSGFNKIILGSHATGFQAAYYSSVEGSNICMPKRIPNMYFNIATRHVLLKPGTKTTLGSIKTKISENLNSQSSYSLQTAIIVIILVVVAIIAAIVWFSNLIELKV